MRNRLLHTVRADRGRRAPTGAASPRPGGGRIVTVLGEVDMASAPALLRALLPDASAPDEQVQVDLAGVTFIDSSGLQTLLVAKAALGDRLVLGAVSRQVRRILDLTGLLAHLGVADAAEPTAAVPSQVRARTAEVATARLEVRRDGTGHETGSLARRR